MSTVEITLKDCYTKQLSKGWNAVITGAGENGQYYTKWAQSDQAAQEELKKILGQSGIKLKLEYEVKGNFKNWTTFEILGKTNPTFKTGGGKVAEEFVGKKPDGVIINDNLTGGERPDIPKPEKQLKREEEIAEAHKKEQEAKKANYREKRRTHQGECLEDAEKAWTKWRYGEERPNLDSDDFRNIRAIANGFMAEDGRKGRY